VAIIMINTAVQNFQLFLSINSVYQAGRTPSFVTVFTTIGAAGHWALASRPYT
jgi:hypothetical protein